MTSSFCRRLWLSVVLCLCASGVEAQGLQRTYDIGSPSYTDIWVDPVNGSDGRIGATRGAAVRTVDRAWRLIPTNTPATPFSATGYRIRLVAGTYPESNMPNYWDARYGSATAPIVIEAADGPRTAILQGDINMAQVAYVYLLNLDIVPEPAGDAFHCESCDHILIRNGRLVGGTWSRTTPAASLAHETVKVNQSTHIYIEDSEIRGAEDNALDFVGVQYGHVVRSRIGNAQDWCGYVKGGSAYLVIEGNTFRDCGTGGFTVGQGTGFQFMTSPWTHYEGYGISVINNLVRQVDGAGLGVNGGYNVLLAWNTLIQTGSRSHVLEVVFGSRSCDGVDGPDRARCSQYLAAGGWGTTRVDDGSNYVRIPNKHVYVVNNLIYNPDGAASRYQQFAIPGAYGGVHQTGSNVPSPARADDDLRILGNVIWNGASTHPLGVGDDSGCLAGNPTCTAGQLVAANAINTIRPVFVNEAGADYRVVPGVLPPPASVPAFGWTDRPASPLAPAGAARDVIAVDINGLVRDPSDHAGAYAPVRPSITTSPRVLRFAATKNGAGASAFTSRTGPQTVAVSFSSGSPTWTLVADQPWVDLSLSAATRTGAASIIVDVANVGVGAATSLTATLTITTTAGSHTPQTIAVYLTVDHTNGAGTTTPFGQVDTPVQGAVGVQGAIGVTGWALDDVGVSSVLIYRNCLTFENQATCQQILGRNVVFVGTAAFLADARPDVEAAFATYPHAHRAGWGFLILSNLLPNIPANVSSGGGVGTFTLYAVATDAEGRQKLLGRTVNDATPTTVTVANDTIAKPFGAIDTPGQGATVTGTLNNFGWVLTPDPGTSVLVPVTGSTINVFVDGAVVGQATYNLCRGSVGNPVPAGLLCDDDVSSIFRSAGSFRNLDAARGPIGLRAINTSAMANGLHTIAWGVTDSAGRSEGIGSRYFNVLNSASDVAPEVGRPALEGRRDRGVQDHAALLPSEVYARTGFDLRTAFTPLEKDAVGVPQVRIPELGRVELQVPGIVDVVLLVNGDVRPAPIGLAIDTHRGVVTWAPGPGYLGTYRLSFVVQGPTGSTVHGSLIEVTVAAASTVDEPVRMHLDRADQHGATFTLHGWALDPHAVTGSGIGAVHMWARRVVHSSTGSTVQGSEPVFLGTAALHIGRSDVAAAHGARFLQAGFSFQGALGDGEWEVTAYIWNTRTGRFEDARTVTITVK